MHVPDSGEGVLARINLIYIGPLDRQHHVRELVQAFLTALDHDPRLHLVVVGDGSERDLIERSLGHAATFMGQLAEPARLAELAPHVDLLVCPTTTADTAPTIIDAQEHGLPVLAVEGGDAAALIENGRSGFLVPDDDAALADAIRWLSRRATLRERLATGGLLAAGARQTSGQGRIMSV
ncbi:MAG: glycosyltransferase [Conexibacteraceae bacterium]|nr:glycosyltransferase [Conexibacteraceae bacterium]